MVSVQGVSGADPLGFDAIFRAHYPFIHRTLRALGVDASVVDDAAQEVFLVVHRRLGEYDGRAAIRAWIFGIARRVAHDFRRGARRRAARLVMIDDHRQVPTPEQQLTQRDAITVIRDFLDTLPELRRAVFVLMELEEMTAPEVASTLDIKLNTVYSHLRKARLGLERVTASGVTPHGKEVIGGATP